MDIEGREHRDAVVSSCRHGVGFFGSNRITPLAEGAGWDGGVEEVGGVGGVVQELEELGGSDLE